MKNHFSKFILFIALILSVQSSLAQTTAFTFQGKLTDGTSSQPTAFTYQGKLTDGGVPANGTYDFQFTLYDAANMNLGSAAGALPVTNGIFTASIDGAAPLFTSSNPARFLEISVKLSGGGPYTTLAPRQPITSSPYSIKASEASLADSLSDACFFCVTDTHIGSVGTNKITGILTVDKGGTGSPTQNFVDLTTNQIIGGSKTISGTFSGNGSGLTNLNGANLTSGSVNAPQLGALSITSTALGDGAVLTNKISDGAVTAGKLAADSVTMPKIVDGSVTTPKIADSSVTEPKLADGSVTAAKLAYGATNQFNPQLIATLRWDLILATNRSDFPTGSNPLAIAFDGTNIWVSNYGDNTVKKLRAGDGATLGTYNVGPFPRHCLRRR